MSRFASECLCKPVEWFTVVGAFGVLLKDVLNNKTSGLGPDPWRWVCVFGGSDLVL